MRRNRLMTDTEAAARDSSDDDGDETQAITPPASFDDVQDGGEPEGEDGEAASSANDGSDGDRPGASASTPPRRHSVWSTGPQDAATEPQPADEAADVSAPVEAGPETTEDNDTRTSVCEPAAAVPPEDAPSADGRGRGRIGYA